MQVHNKRTKLSESPNDKRGNNQRTFFRLCFKNFPRKLFRTKKFVESLLTIIAILFLDIDNILVSIDSILEQY